MPSRKKPEGQAFEDWCKMWDTEDHEGKVKLCQDTGITYETGRHWRSDAGLPSQVTPKPMRMNIEEIVGMRPAVNLDFVSFDIETSNLKADFSVLLSAVIKPYGMRPIVFRADDYEAWEKNRSNDSQITLDICEELSKHAIVITHYGSKFDVPYMRAKAVHWGIPPLPQMFAIDSWRIAKFNFQVSSRRLQNLGNYFNLGEKSGVEGMLWMEAAYDGSREAMDEIVKHNIVDCEVLEKLAAVSFPYLKSIPKL